MSAWMIGLLIALVGYGWGAADFYRLGKRQDPPVPLLVVASLVWLPIIAWYWARVGVRRLRGAR